MSKVTLARVWRIIRGYQQLPWDEELIPLDIDDWLMPVVITLDQIQAEKNNAGTREIKLGQGLPQYPEGALWTSQSSL